MVSGADSLLIIVVEDDKGIQELLRYTLERAGYRTLCAESAEQAELLIKGQTPDLAILDWMLPDMSGLSLTRKWRRDAVLQQLPIIMVTARGEESDRVVGLEGGADDYMVKPFSPKELVARVQAVLRRRSPELAEGRLRVGALLLDTRSYEVQVNGEPISLTASEFKLLRFLMANPGRVYSRQQLLDNCWGNDVYIDERTVDVHIRRLRVALGVTAESMVETVRGAGYKLVANTEA